MDSPTLVTPAPWIARTIRTTTVSAAAKRGSTRGSSRSLPYNAGYGNLAWDGDGHVLVVATDTGEVYRIDRVTGAVTTLSFLGGRVFSVVYYPALDRIYAGDETGTLWDIDPITGAAAPLVNIGAARSLMGIDIAPASFGAYGDWLALASGFVHLPWGQQYFLQRYYYEQLLTVGRVPLGNADLLAGSHL